MNELGKLGTLETAASPSCPPDAQIAGEVREFLERYSFLYNDPGYVSFLGCYAGAGLKSRDDMLSLDIFGFSEEVTLHLTRGEGDVIENSMLTFADLLIPEEPGRGVFVKTIGCGFGFPAASERRWGVYWIDDDGCYWYCDTFINWLSDFVHKNGRLIKPS